MKVNEYLYKKLSERNMGFINNNIDANILYEGMESTRA